MSRQKVTVRVVTRTRTMDSPEETTRLRSATQLRYQCGADEDDVLYLNKLRDILSSSMYGTGVPYEPTMVHGLVYLGTQANAENIDGLRRLKIKHVLNCAGLPQSLYHARAERYIDAGIQYTELPMDDGEHESIIGFFGLAHGCIDKAVMRQERILIHCSGVSRSGAIALSYLLKCGKRLLSAAKDLKSSRRVVLCHDGFMDQLVSYARAQGMLDPEPEYVKAPKYGQAYDAKRLNYAHIPQYMYTYGDKVKLSTTRLY